jgi:hypothetical protein
MINSISDSELKELRFWAVSEYIEACDKIEICESPQKGEKNEENTVPFVADPEELKMWNHKCAMMEKIAMAITELIKIREQIREKKNGTA